MEEAAIRNWSFGFQINFGRIAASSYPNINRVVNSERSEESPFSNL